MEALADLQAGSLEFCKPGQWFGRCHNRNRAHVVWTVSGTNGVQQCRADVRDAINNYPLPSRKAAPWVESALSAGRSSKRDTGHPDSSFKFRFFTGLQWIDVVDLVIEDSGSPGTPSEPGWSPHGVVRVDAQSASLACVPAGVPCALPLSIALCWVPFDDHGANLARLQAFRTRLEQVTPPPTHTREPVLMRAVLRFFRRGCRSKKRSWSAASVSTVQSGPASPVQAPRTSLLTWY
jgi:hypothetical protein